MFASSRRIGLVTASSKWLAKLWRNVCGETRFGMPVLAAACLTALAVLPKLLSHAWVPIREDSLISRLTLESASKQIALRMNARSPFLSNKRSDNSDLA
jgi:hypothetical protein